VTWADFYLVCFVVGLFLSVVMFLAGGAHLPHVHIHLPGAHGHFGIGHGATAGHGTQVGPVNPITLTAFLAWFGGTGYLLSRHSGLAYASALILAILVLSAPGIAGAAGKTRGSRRAPVAKTAAVPERHPEPKSAEPESVAPAPDVRDHGCADLERRLKLSGASEALVQRRQQDPAGVVAVHGLEQDQVHPSVFILRRVRRRLAPAAQRD